MSSVYSKIRSEALRENRHGNIERTVSITKSGSAPGKPVGPGLLGRLGNDRFPWAVCLC